MPPARPLDHRVVAHQGKALEALDTPPCEVVLDPRRCGPLGKTCIVCHVAAELDQERTLPVGRTFRLPSPDERLQMFLEQYCGNAAGLGSYQSEPNRACELTLSVRRRSRAFLEQPYGLVPGGKRHLAI